MERIGAMIASGGALSNAVIYNNTVRDGILGSRIIHVAQVFTMGVIQNPATPANIRSLAQSLLDILTR